MTFSAIFCCRGHNSHLTDYGSKGCLLGKLAYADGKRKKQIFIREKPMKRLKMNVLSFLLSKKKSIF